MIVIGHRGAAGLAPENTIKSLEKALQHKVDMVEYDLRVTKDKVVVLHHNPYIIDASGNNLQINKSSYKELLRHKSDLATLEQVLDEFGNKTRMYIEVKPKEDTRPIVRVLKARLDNGLKKELIFLGSFDQKVLRQLHKELPDIKNIVIEKWSGVKAHLRAAQIDTDIVSMYYLWLWPGFIKAVSRKGWTLYAFTLNNPKKARRWARYGLSGAVTDFPDKFQK